MAQRNLARYEEDDALAELARAMKNVRKLAGLSQEELGKQIGISRESVLHIEGLYESSLLSLECEVLRRWYAACAGKAPDEDVARLYQAVNDYLFPV